MLLCWRFRFFILRSDNFQDFQITFPLGIDCPTNNKLFFSSIISLWLLPTGSIMIRMEQWVVCLADLVVPPASRKQHISVSQLTLLFVDSDSSRNSRSCRNIQNRSVTDPVSEPASMLNYLILDVSIYSNTNATLCVIYFLYFSILNTLLISVVTSQACVPYYSLLLQSLVVSKKWIIWNPSLSCISMFWKLH